MTMAFPQFPNVRRHVQGKLSSRNMVTPARFAGVVCYSHPEPPAFRGALCALVTGFANSKSTQSEGIGPGMMVHRSLSRVPIAGLASRNKPTIAEYQGSRMEDCKSRQMSAKLNCGRSQGSAPTVLSHRGHVVPLHRAGGQTFRRTWDSSFSSIPELSKSRLSFDGPEAAAACTRGKSWGDLCVSASVFGVCASEKIVRNSQKLLDVSCKVLGTKPTMWLLKQSFYKVFCGGEDLNEVRGTMDKLRKRGVQSVLDYAVEASPDDVAAMSAETFEENLRLTWDAVKAVSDERDGLVAVKVTALGPTSTMERAGIVTAAVERLFAELCGVPVSAGHRRTLPDLLISKELTKETFVKGIQQLQTEKSMPVAPEGELNRIFNRLLEQPGGGDDKTKVSFYQWCHLLQPHMVGRADLSVFKELIPPLSDEDVKEVEATEERLFRLCEMTEKVETKPSLLVDAEHSPLQGFIRAVTINAQKKFNKNGKSLVYNTYQAYLKETKSQLTSDLEMARRFGVTFALKLVRGAYMSFERRTAEENGYPSPVHDCLEDTHNSYDACVRLLLSNIDRVALFMGSHNAESLQKATALLYEICEERNSGVGKDGKPGAGASTDLLTPASLPVSFGQLLGMGDHLTFTLSDSGFRVYKYVPYGPVDVTIPYLLRRAQENAGMMGGAGRELFFVAEEVKNRVKGWLGRKEQTSDSGQYATRR